MAPMMNLEGILEQWYSFGFFSYVLPFLIIFAVTFGILQKSKIFGDEEKVKGINAILALAIGLVSLQFGFVKTFFESIFPLFGIGISILLVVLIFVGLFFSGEIKDANLSWLGWTIGGVVVIWAFIRWGNDFGVGGGVGYWIQDYFWTVVFIVGLGLLIKAVISPNKKGTKGNS